jgi:hypothetical protein
MNRRNTLVWITAGALSPIAAHASAPAAAVRPTLSHDLQRVSQWVLATGDNRRRPFAVVDKRQALIGVYSADGLLGGLSRVLLGRTPGDHVVPGVGDRAQHGALLDGDCTTPAGRFVSEPGRNRTGEAIVWLDYVEALAIHRLRPGPDAADRARRLASADVRNKRATAGCVVVPGDFYDGVVQPLLGSARGVVYVLPETPDASSL